MSKLRPALLAACLAACLAAAPSSAGADVSGGGVTLRSVAVELPDGDRPVPAGPGAELVSANCLSCHSAGMMTAQPKLSAAAWEGEVKKMRAVYKAPLADEDMPAIVAYLVAMQAR